MKVAIVDYGMGNLHSVLKSVQAAQALSNQNAEIYLTVITKILLTNVIFLIIFVNLAKIIGIGD